MQEARRGGPGKHMFANVAQESLPTKERERETEEKLDMRYFGFAERSGDHRRDSAAARRLNEHMFLGMTSYSYGVVHQDEDRKWS